MTASTSALSHAEEDSHAERSLRLRSLRCQSPVLEMHLILTGQTYKVRQIVNSKRTVDGTVKLSGWGILTDDGRPCAWHVAESYGREQIRIQRRCM